MKQDENTVREVRPIGDELHGGLWHVTHPERFLAILKCGSIVPEPDIADSERWKTSRGKDYYPFVRAIGGISLFDFSDFEPQSYSLNYPASDWREFVPYRKIWGGAVWMAIDREQALPHFISASELKTQWMSGGHYKHTLMPLIEAAYLGPLPLSACQRALFICAVDDQYHELEITGFNRSAYDVLLNGWRVNCEKPLITVERKVSGKKSFYGRDVGPTHGGLSEV
jgi:hypothetical protein